MQPWRVPRARYLARKSYPDPFCVLTAPHPTPQVQPGPILQADEVRAAPEVSCGRVAGIQVQSGWVWLQPSDVQVKLLSPVAPRHPPALGATQGKGCKGFLQLLTQVKAPKRATRQVSTPESSTLMWAVHQDLPQNILPPRHRLKSPSVRHSSSVHSAGKRGLGHVPWGSQDSDLYHPHCQSW